MSFIYTPSSCPICGHNDFSDSKKFRIVRRGHFSILKEVLDQPIFVVLCNSCKHRYMNPAPDEASLRAYYQKGYFDEDESAPSNVSAGLQLSDKFYFRTCRNLPKCPGKLLEIGPGNRKYLLWAKNKGWQVEGFDYGEYPCVTGSEKIPVRIGTLSPEAFPENTFDVLALWWVLEHLKNPVEILSICRKFLKEDGRVLISVPNYATPWPRIFGSYWHHLVLPDHLSQFTPSSAKKMLERAGFEVETVDYNFISFDVLASLADFFQARFGVGNGLQNTFFRALSLPFGLLFKCLKWSGNITVQARVAQKLKHQRSGI